MAIEHHLAPEGMAPGNGYSHAVAGTGRLVAIAGQVAITRAIGPRPPLIDLTANGQSTPIIRW
ncbi:MAG TPA: hypothetical protein VGB19_06365 [Actinomycetota bacterium]